MLDVLHTGTGEAPGKSACIDEVRTPIVSSPAILTACVSDPASEAQKDSHAPFLFLDLGASVQRGMHTTGNSTADISAHHAACSQVHEIKPISPLPRDLLVMNSGPVPNGRMQKP